MTKSSRVMVLSFLLLVTLSTALADFDVVIQPEHPFTKNIRFVVDVSGSMSEKRLSAAIQSVLTISQQPIDELQVALITFDDDHSVWPGKPDPDAYRPVPSGWAQLPDPQVTGGVDENGHPIPNSPGELSAFIQGHLKGGNTRPRSAIMAAIDDRKDLTVVIITDGEFQGDYSAEGKLLDPLTFIPILQAARAGVTHDAAGKLIHLEPATIVFYSVVEEGAQNESIHKQLLGYTKEYGTGGYFRYRSVESSQSSEPVPDDLPDAAKGTKIGPY